MQVDNFALARVFFSLYSQLTDEKTAERQMEKQTHSNVQEIELQIWISSVFGDAKRWRENTKPTTTTNMKYQINENDLRFGVRHFWRAT